jgi:hypothetical protein
MTVIRKGREIVIGITIGEITIGGTEFQLRKVVVAGGGFALVAGNQVIDPQGCPSS